MVKLFLDAGHGGTDPGAVGNGLKEAEINLRIVLKMRTYLKANYENVEIMLSRENDTTLSLSNRTNKANQWGADALVSVHVNSATASATGFETFVYPNAGSKTKAMQNLIHQEILAQIQNEGIRDRGKKQANFHMLRESNMSAVLTENLFINNSSDASKLKNDAFLDKLAKGHAIGLAKFFGLVEKNDPTPINPNDDELYQVITGTFNERKNAETQVEQLKKDGYKPYINTKDK